MVGFICCAIGSWKLSADVLDCVDCATIPSVGGRSRQSESIPSETSIFPIIWSTIAWISTASRISSGVRVMISSGNKSLIAATIVKTMLVICCSTIGVKAASRLTIRIGG